MIFIILVGNWHPEAIKKVYRDFHLKLLESLPMHNAAFLNQACAGRGPGFLKLFLCGCLYVCLCMCLCVCPPPRLLITSGVMWHDMDPI